MVILDIFVALFAYLTWGWFVESSSKWLTNSSLAEIQVCQCLSTIACKELHQDSLVKPVVSNHGNNNFYVHHLITTQSIVGSSFFNMNINSLICLHAKVESSKKSWHANVNVSHSWFNVPLVIWRSGGTWLFPIGIHHRSISAIYCAASGNKSPEGTLWQYDVAM